MWVGLVIILPMQQEQKFHVFSRERNTSNSTWSCVILVFRIDIAKNPASSSMRLICFSSANNTSFVDYDLSRTKKRKLLLLLPLPMVLKEIVNT
jgi:hypothetical protein